MKELLKVLCQNKQDIAKSLGITRQTLDNYLSGETEPKTKTKKLILERVQKIVDLSKAHSVE